MNLQIINRVIQFVNSAYPRRVIENKPMLKPTVFLHCGLTRTHVAISPFWCFVALIALYSLSVFFPVTDFFRITVGWWLLNPSLLSALSICKTLKSDGNGGKHATSWPRPYFETECISENSNTLCGRIYHTREQLSLHGKTDLILLSRRNQNCQFKFQNHVNNY